MRSEDIQNLHTHQEDGAKSYLRVTTKNGVFILGTYTSIENARRALEIVIDDIIAGYGAVYVPDEQAVK